MNQCPIIVLDQRALHISTALLASVGRCWLGGWILSAAGEYTSKTGTELPYRRTQFKTKQVSAARCFCYLYPKQQMPVTPFLYCFLVWQAPPQVTEIQKNLFTEGNKFSLIVQGPYPIKHGGHMLNFKHRGLVDLNITIILPKVNSIWVLFAVPGPKCFEMRWGL